MSLQIKDPMTEADFCRIHRVTPSGELPRIQRLRKTLGELKNVYFQPIFQDHPRLWVRDERPFLWTSEPYDLDKEQLQELLDYCHENELSVRISGTSPYNQGQTMLIIVQRLEDLEA